MADTAHFSLNSRACCRACGEMHPEIAQCKGSGMDGQAGMFRSQCSAEGIGGATIQIKNA